MRNDPEATYEHLISRRDLLGLDDDRALEHIGELTDLSGDLRRKEGLEQAVMLSDERGQHKASSEMGA